MTHILLLILYFLAVHTVCAGEPTLKYSTFFGNYVGSYSFYMVDMSADVDSDGNIYVMAEFFEPVDPAWPEYDRQCIKLIRISPDGSNAELLLDIEYGVDSKVECHQSGNIYVMYMVDPYHYVVRIITPDGQDVHSMVMPFAPEDHYIDNEGNVYFIGTISEDRAAIIPITGNAIDSTFNGGNDIVIQKYNASLELAYSSFLGGELLDYACSINGTGEGTILISGKFSEPLPYLDDGSSEAVLLMPPSLDSIIEGRRQYPIPMNQDSFYDSSINGYYSLYNDSFTRYTQKGVPLWKFYIDGINPVIREYSKTADASELRNVRGISGDSNGNVYHTINANRYPFPITDDAYDPTFNGEAYDITISRINPDGVLEYATYFGGSGKDISFTNSTDFENGIFYCVGVTNSTDFPTTPGAYRETFTAEPEKYEFFAFALDFNEITEVAEDLTVTPDTFIFDPPHPNPFNPETTISFTLPDAAAARLIIYDISGRKVRELVGGQLSAGQHEFVWDGCDGNGDMVSSGVYFSRLLAGENVAVRKVTLVR